MTESERMAVKANLDALICCGMSDRDISYFLNIPVDEVAERKAALKLFGCKIK